MILQSLFEHYQHLGVADQSWHGKVKIADPVQKFVTINRAVNQIDSLSLTESHVWTFGTLPSYHRDPFDRILIAQAMTEDWTVVSVDEIFSQYPVKLLN